MSRSIPINYCTQCGENVSLRTPSYDDRPRHVCDACGYVHYQNPNIVNGAIIERLGDPDQSLLFWYLPILFIGLAGMGLGTGLSILAVIQLRNPRSVTENRNKKEKHHE